MYAMSAIEQSGIRGEAVKTSSQSADPSFVTEYAQSLPGFEDIPETAYVKLGWVLGQTDNSEKVKELMLSPISDDMTEREPYNGYLVYQGGASEVADFVKRVHK